ncbi:uncharacterized protein LOC143368762 [Andrena cerasifolii]|uniref:uncharacterized protein LOC143368762 n=1 Tax=Andrena cerasifolii TaxID=2819439 RepID=UPI0040376B79
MSAISFSLLEVFEKHESLWNPRHPRYFDTIKKDDAWCTIAQEIGTEAEECKRKVESLKSSYRREKGKIKKSTTTGRGSDEIYHSKWFAFKAMQFLDDNTEPRNTISTADMDEAVDADILINPVDDVAPEETSPRAKQIKSPKKSCKRKEDPRIDEAFKYLKTAIHARNSESDECPAFGRYVAAKLQKFNNQHRMVAQHKSSNILYEIEMSSLIPPSPNPSQQLNNTSHAPSSTFIPQASSSTFYPQASSSTFIPPASSSTFIPQASSSTFIPPASSSTFIPQSTNPVSPPTPPTTTIYTELTPVSNRHDSHNSSHSISDNSNTYDTYPQSIPPSESSHPSPFSNSSDCTLNSYFSHFSDTDN